MCVSFPFHPCDDDPAMPHATTSDALHHGRSTPSTSDAGVSSDINCPGVQRLIHHLKEFPFPFLPASQVVIIWPFIVFSTSLTWPPRIPISSRFPLHVCIVHSAKRLRSDGKPSRLGYPTMTPRSLLMSNAGHTDWITASSVYVG